MRRGRPAPQVELTPEERTTLTAWAADDAQARELALRARIVLCCADGWTNMAVARHLGVTRETVGKWRRRYMGGRLHGLFDEPRPGAPSTIRDEDVERVRRLSASVPPAGRHWTTRSMARSAHLSQTAVSRIWKIFTLEPHTSLPRHFPKEGLGVERMRFIAGIYLDPPLRAMALCCDPPARTGGSAEAPREPRAINGSDPAGVVRRSLFADLDLRVRQANGHVGASGRREDFLPFLEAVECVVPDGCELHLVLGCLSVHKLPDVDEWLRRRERFYAHFIPTSGAWLRLVEGWSSFHREMPARERGGDPTSTRPQSDLDRAVRFHLEQQCGFGQPFRWVRSRDVSAVSASAG